MRGAKLDRAALGYRWFALLGALSLYPIRDGFQS
jgi:hypothetical protein